MRITDIRKLTPEQKTEQLKVEYSKYCSIEKCVEKFECLEEHVLTALLDLNIFEKRKCSGDCREWKPFSEFHKYNRSFTGITSKCKICRNKAGKVYHSKEEVKIRHNNYLKEYNKTDKAKNLKKEYKQKESAKEIRRNYENHKRKTDVFFALHKRISKLLRNALIKKNGQTWPKLLGFSSRELEKSLRKRMIEGMSWKNFLKSELQIDHIRPINSFDMSKREEFNMCWSLENFQLLWVSDNTSKQDKWDGTPENISFNLQYITLAEFRNNLRLMT
jgi:hypothetical protein